MRVLALVLLVAAAVHAAEWKIVAKNIATIDIGVSFNTALNGYTAGTLNGQGPAIFRSQDGGSTWTPCNVTSFGADLLLLDVDAVDETIVVSSIAGELYSADGGKSFHQSIGGGMSQSVRHIGPNGSGGHKFACTGSYPARKKNGVAISVNSGRTFSVFDANLFTDARYGAFPQGNNWYVAAGEWPQAPTPTSDDDGPLKRPALRGRSQMLTAEGRLVPRSAAPANDDANPGIYSAQISKSTDGGITWTTLFGENNTFYFNGIDCSPDDPNHCCAAGEGFSQPPNPSTEPGARIHCTKDGGRTWTRTFFKAEDTLAYSLMELRFANATEVHAVGGVLGSIGTPWFLHSSDGGDTWTATEATFGKGAIATSVSMLNPSVGWAVLENSITQAADIAKYGGL